MLVTTEAIILKSMKYRDTSKIVTFYTRGYGKLQGIAKGARMAKNKFGSALEPMSHSMLVFYKKEHQDLHLVSQCDTISSLKKLTDDLDRMTSALAVIELVNKVTHEGESNIALFTLIVDTLTVLNSIDKNYNIIFQAFRLQLVALFGFAPEFEKCGECNEIMMMTNDAKEKYAINIAKGALICSHCHYPSDKQLVVNHNSTNFIYISIQTLQLLRRMMKVKISSLSNLEYNASNGNEIDELLRLYFQYHFEELKSLKSTTIFNHYN